MPLVRINIAKSASPKVVRTISDVVCQWHGRQGRHPHPGRLVSLGDVAREDRSFGNGDMQYAPKTR